MVLTLYFILISCPNPILFETMDRLSHFLIHKIPWDMGIKFSKTVTNALMWASNSLLKI